MDLAAVFEDVYRTREPPELSWFQAEPTASLELIDALGVTPDRSVIDLPRVEAAVRSALGADGYAEAFARGRTTTIRTLRELLADVL